jgi:hypothetical protein
MGQFDSEMDAALSQVEWEEISKAPGTEFAEIIGDIAAVVGTKGPLALAGKISNLLIKVRRLAGASYTSNLIYLITAVKNDMDALYEKCEEQRERIESLGSDPRFAEAISALALRAMHTSARERLKRMARIVVNGFRENDLEPESLDDMLRAVTELTDRDILVLTRVADEQAGVTIYSLATGDGTINLPREIWQKLEGQKFITPQSQMIVRSSLARLQALGFGAEIQTMESSWLPRFLVADEGKKFLKYLREIA